MLNELRQTYTYTFMSNFNCVLTKVVIAILFFTSGNGADYLQERPDFLTPCKLHAPNSGQCMAQSIENVLTHWRSGIPGLERIGALEPFRVKRVRIEQHLQNVDIQVALRNMRTYGLTDSRLLNGTIDATKYAFAFNVQMPNVTIESDYQLKGRVLLLNMNGRGKLNVKLTKLEYSIALATQLKQNGSEYFFDLQEVRTNVKRVGGFHIRLHNLFGGNMELEDSAHELFNDNWRDIFDVLRPVLSETYDAVLQSRFRKLFSYIPARFFFEDLP